MFLCFLLSPRENPKPAALGGFCRKTSPNCSAPPGPAELYFGSVFPGIEADPPERNQWNQCDCAHERMSATVKQHGQREPVMEQRRGQGLFLDLFCSSVIPYPFPPMKNRNGIEFLGSAKEKQFLVESKG